MPNENAANLMVTAFYTAQTWYWAGIADADLFNSRHGRRVFRIANGLMALARTIRPSLPSLPHALVQRHVIIDRLYEESREMQVLELAAGFSRRGATYSRSQDVDYTEVDLDPVIDRKRRLLKRSEEGRLVLHWKNLHFRIVVG